MTARRELIMQHLKERFEALQAGVNGYNTTWTNVVRRPMSDAEIRMGNALGIYDIAEEKTPQIARYECRLTVLVEFFCLNYVGDEPGTELNKMLIDVQRAMQSDVNCGGLTYSIYEKRNELDIQGPSDGITAGVAEFEIQYRHALADPAEAI